MTRRIFSAIAATAIITASAMAQSALPKDGKDVALPSGHPAIPGAAGGAPEGALPSGHPDISQLMKNASTQPAATSGSIAIRAFQGTKGAEALKGGDVVVELYHKGQVVKKYDGKLDANGILVIDKIPLAVPVQPIVTVKHADVDYQAIGEVMNGQQSQQQVDVPVFEIAAQAPAWKVQMRHIIVDPTPEGLKVTEMFAVENPADRTWLGNEKHVTLELAMTPGVKGLEMAGGFDEKTAKIDGTKLVSTSPIRPGTSQFQLTYIVPGKDGKASFSQVAPADISKMVLFVTDLGTAIDVKGMDASGSHDMGKAKVKMFLAKDLKPGQASSVTITLPAPGSMPKPGMPSGHPPVGAADGQMPKIVAGVGGGIALVVGAGVVLLKSPKGAGHSQHSRRA